jgi:hypothetical protein
LGLDASDINISGIINSVAQNINVDDFVEKAKTNLEIYA